MRAMYEPVSVAVEAQSTCAPGGVVPSKTGSELSCVGRKSSGGKNRMLKSISQIAERKQKGPKALAGTTRSRTVHQKHAFCSRVRSRVGQAACCTCSQRSPFALRLVGGAFTQVAQYSTGQHRLQHSFLPLFARSLSQKLTEISARPTEKDFH